MNIIDFYEGKIILLTGATGFLGKVILEKILRSLPQVRKIYLLIRQKKGSPLVERYKREILGSQCFDRLRSQLGKQFDSYVEEKIQPVDGDMLKENLGLSPDNLQEIIQHANVVINCAASVDFNARLDEALTVNVMGTYNIFQVTCQMKQLQCFVHVSTCYVNSDKLGWIEEKIYESDIQNPMEITQKLLKIPIGQIEAETKDIIGAFPNTYTFSKNIAERMLLQLRPPSMPLVILRPSIIGASIKDPVPGWIDSLAASAAIFFFTGIGLVKDLYGDENMIGDQVPVDMVADSILVAAAFEANKPKLEVYNICSSARNPMTWKVSKECVLKYWNTNPTRTRISSARVKFHKNYHLYQLSNRARKIPAQVYHSVSETVGSQGMRIKANRMMKMVQRADQINKTFEHFINKEWIFDSGKTNNLIIYLQGQKVKDVFNIDMTSIVWRDYLLKFNHGIRVYILKENIESPFNDQRNDILQMADRSTYFSDIEWVMKQGAQFKTKTNIEHISMVMNSQKVSTVMKMLVDERASKLGRGKVVNYEKIQKEVEMEAVDICKVMFADYSMSMIRWFGWFLTKVFRSIYDKVVIDDITLKNLRDHDQKKNGPLILMPTHRSYIDFLMCSYVFFAYSIKTPHIATAEDFLSMAIVPMILRASGAFFLKRKSLEDSILYKTIFTEYVQRLLQDECYLEFFIEGTRSRSGKTLQPKFGLLNIVSDTVFEGKLPDVTFLPITINYEKVLEADTYPYELLGEEKVKESLLRVIKASRILSTNFGRIYIEFGSTISLKNFSSKYNTISVIQKDPILKKQIVSDLGYEIVYSMLDKIVVMPTSMVSAILLMHRRGITEDMLIQKMEWLSQLLQARGAKTANINVSQVDVIVRNAINLLSDIIVKTKKNIFELQVSPNLDYKNILLLSYYRNQLIHVFVHEGIVCCALTAFGHQIAFKDGITIERLWEETDFLLKLLNREFVLKRTVHNINEFKSLLNYMVEKQVLQIEGNKVRISEKKGELTVQFLCSLVWPMIESYWVTLVYLYSVQRNHNSIVMKKLIQQIQWFAESMHEERVMEHYESCSQETIKNAISIYKGMNIISIEKDDKQIEELVSVITNEQKLLDLENQLKKFLKNSFAKSIQTPFDIARRSMTVDYSFMPKL